MFVCYKKVTSKSVDVLYMQGLNFREKKNPPGVGFQQLHTICKRAGGCIYVFGFSEVFVALTCGHCVYSYLKSPKMKKMEKKQPYFSMMKLGLFLDHEHPLPANTAHDTILFVIDSFCISRNEHLNKVNTGWVSEQINN